MGCPCAPWVLSAPWTVPWGWVGPPPFPSVGKAQPFGDCKEVLVPGVSPTPCTQPASAHTRTGAELFPDSVAFSPGGHTEAEKSEPHFLGEGNEAWLPPEIGSGAAEETESPPGLRERGGAALPRDPLG